MLDFVLQVSRREIRINWGQGIVGYVAQTGVSCNVKNCYEDPRLVFHPYPFIHPYRFIHPSHPHHPFNHPFHPHPSHLHPFNHSSHPHPFIYSYQPYY